MLSLTFKNTDRLYVASNYDSLGYVKSYTYLIPYSVDLINLILSVKFLSGCSANGSRREKVVRQNRALHSISTWSRFLLFLEVTVLTGGKLP